MKRVALSLLVFVGGILTGTVGASLTHAQEPRAATATTSAAGRYQIVFSPHLRADTFLLDTDTGRVWMQTKYTAFEGDPLVWDLQERIDDAESYRAWAARQKRKNQ